MTLWAKRSSQIFNETIKYLEALFKESADKLLLDSDKSNDSCEKNIFSLFFI